LAKIGRDGFAIVLDHQSETPLHQQLYDELRQAILNGLLPRETALHQINCPIAPHFLHHCHKATIVCRVKAT